ncbi:tetratricopeptide repeat protein [Lutimaribacter marinistellae]|uniref:Tetratricopeptide repeat protein n=1 Tax=Lutimaribacter marinistellae TaxID=1820329 RepID=A0ABV7TPJ4_9RHOB
MLGSFPSRKAFGLCVTFWVGLTGYDTSAEQSELIGRYAVEYTHETEQGANGAVCLDGSGTFEVLPSLTVRGVITNSDGQEITYGKAKLNGNQVTGSFLIQGKDVGDFSGAYADGRWRGDYHAINGCSGTWRGEKSEAPIDLDESTKQKVIDSFFDGNYTAALSTLEILAQQGDARARYVLAFAYENGLGKETDLQEAVRWYSKAADGGHLKAMVRLGELYAVGFAVEEQSDELAVMYMRKAAMRRDPEALHFMGMFFTWGILGVRRDTDQALPFFWLAAAQGLEPSISQRAALEVSEGGKQALFAEMARTREQEEPGRVATLASHQTCLDSLKSQSFQAASMYLALIVAEEREDYFFAALLGGSDEYSPLGESYWECSGRTLSIWF